jgi:hypothetical protein
MDKSRRDELAAETDAVEAAVQQAVAEALRAHKRAGNTVVGWQNGKVVWVPADQIVVDDEPATSE